MLLLGTKKSNTFQYKYRGTTESSIPDILNIHLTMELMNAMCRFELFIQ